MAEKTTIPWCDHTFNPWWGCTEVSEGCANCYAKVHSTRFSPGLWGANGRRRFFDGPHWNNPIVWNRNAKAAGETRRVFCGSMCDIIEEDGPDVSRRSKELERLGELIVETPHLTWLLLSKRSWAGAQKRCGWDEWPRNAWAGNTVENEHRMGQLGGDLADCPAPVLFLSVEPMLGPVSIQELASIRGVRERLWVICGGESGPKARKMDPRWSTALFDECRDLNVPFYGKQQGRWHSVGRDGAMARCPGRDHEPLFIRGSVVRQWPVQLGGRR